MLWNDIVNQVGSYAQQEPAVANPSFTLSLPTFTSSAELRIYRDLDFLSARGQNATVSFTTGSRTLSLAGMTGALIGGFPVQNAYPVVVQGIAAILPAATLPAAGKRVRFLLTTVDFIDSIWPSEATTQAPADGQAYYAMLDHQTAIVAPTPDAAYKAEVTGTWRPAPMSPAQPESWLGDNLPDLLLKATLVEAFSWEENYQQTMAGGGASAYWEGEYQKAKQTAIEEEQRRRGQDPGWAPFSPTPLAGNPRT